MMFGGRRVSLNHQTVNGILEDFGTDDRVARELLPHAYEELRRLASTHFADERGDHTLQPTALVNEAFLRLASDTSIRVSSRGHFFRLASKVMRQILVDHARSKLAQKRGGQAERITISGLASGETVGALEYCDLLGLEEALQRLAKLSGEKARLVELRYFGGLTIEEAADALGISRTQASRDWRMARAWLADELRERTAP